MAKFEHSEDISAPNEAGSLQHVSDMSVGAPGFDQQSWQ